MQLNYEEVDEEWKSVMSYCLFLHRVFCFAANRGSGAAGSSQTGDALGKALASVRKYLLWNTRLPF